MRCAKMAESIEAPFDDRLMWAQGTIIRCGTYRLHLVNIIDRSLIGGDAGCRYRCFPVQFLNFPGACGHSLQPEYIKYETFIIDVHHSHSL